MKHWKVRLLAGGFAVFLAVTIYAWHTVHASLPQLDGEIRITGIEASVTIERDAAGVPTITAGDRGDLAFATGFAHGQDRFFQMDLIRRQAAGELSAMIGAAAIAADKRNRLHRFRSRAREAVSVLPATDKRLLERYALGVNAGLRSLRKKPFEYFLLSVEPEDWTAEDSVLVIYAMFLQLNDARATRDIRRGLAARILPGEVYAWLYPRGTKWDAPLMGAPRTIAAAPPADVFSIRDVTDDAPPANERGKNPLAGSNNWAVSGRLTDTGRAIVANDMHLGLSAPNIYYRARLVVDNGQRRDITGVTLPGTPLIVAGSNGKVAWGYTNSYGDWSDAVLVKPGSAAGTYVSPEGELPIIQYREVIEVKDGEPAELLVRETTWGPIVDDVDYPEGEIAVSWIAHHVAAVNLRLVDLETVATVNAALDVANSMGIPPQNFVAGDSAGNIGWSIAGKIPVRTDFDATLPADWSAGHGWLGWLEAEQYPRLVNPDGGRIWTANARAADGRALEIIGDGGYDLGARAGQIRDSLFSKDRFSPADMLTIQYDDRALFLERWRLLLLELLDAETIAGQPDLIEYRDLVANWIPHAAPESVGYRLVRAFRLEVQTRVFHSLMASVRAAYGGDVELRISNQFEAPLWTLVSERPEHLLPGNYGDWRELMLAAVRDNIRYFRTNFDGPLARRVWGERNAARIEHPLSRALPWLSGWLDMPPDPLSGDMDLPKAQSPDFGASERFAVAPGDEANGFMHMPTGQSGHPLSDFYRSGHEDWLRGRPSPFLPAETRHRLKLVPGG